MITRILIARHGNTFTADETPRRLGGRTDLSLVEDRRARGVGKYLKMQGIKPDIILASPLKRTMETAEYICEELDIDKKIIIKEDSLKEVDYGPDENKTEEEVMLRLGDGDLEKGKAVIDAWNKDTTVPEGWLVNPQDYIDTWVKVGKEAEEKYAGRTVLIVSSNGVIRFAPHLTGDFKKFSEEFNIKVTTGGLCIFEKEASEPNWRCIDWNVKCKKIMEERETDKESCSCVLRKKECFFKKLLAYFPFCKKEK